MKRILIPPLLPVAMIALLSIWVIIDETQSAPRMIDGNPDDAPRNAAGILILLAPLLYLPFGILNWIDSVFDRFSQLRAWAGSVGICMIFSGLLSTVFNRPGLDSSPIHGIAIAVLIGFLCLLPMTLLRRLALTPRKDANTMISGASIPFETLFPDAGTPMAISKTKPSGS